MPSRRVRNRNSLIADIRAGDVVTIIDRFQREHTGRAVMPSQHGGWVLNMGGRHGIPAIADYTNIVRVTRPKERRRADHR